VPEVLPARECWLWAVPLDALSPADEALYLSWLSPAERARLDGFRFDRDRRQHLVGRALLRAALSRHTGVDPRAWVFGAGAHGKPHVEQPVPSPVAFNVAHAAGLVVCAVAAVEELGVDVEKIDAIDDPLTLAETACSPPERARLEALPASHRAAHFATLFTLKEAYLKARGLGLSVPLAALTISLEGPSPALALAAPLADDAAAWQLTPLAMGGYQLAVALRGRGFTVQLRETPTAAIHVA
jgi:4'-phosphopantetheinyl transferase